MELTSRIPLRTSLVVILQIGRVLSAAASIAGFAPYFILTEMNPFLANICTENDKKCEDPLSRFHSVLRKNNQITVK